MVVGRAVVAVVVGEVVVAVVEVLVVVVMVDGEEARWVLQMVDFFKLSII